MSQPSPLSAEAAAAVEGARRRPLSYAVRMLEAPDGRLLVIIGEAHLKLRRAAELGQALVGAFELRGVETFPKERVAAGRITRWLVDAPRLLLRALSFGAVKGSTITEARRAPSGRTFLLESVSPIALPLHVASVYLALFFAATYALFLAIPLQAHLPPRLLSGVGFLVDALALHLLLLIPALLLQRRRWAWLVHPLLPILTTRNRMMAEGTAAMLRQFAAPGAAIVIMGRAHVRGYARELVEKHAFRRLSGPPAPGRPSAGG